VVIKRNMLYLFYGTDNLQAREGVTNLLRELREQTPNLTVYNQEPASYTAGEWASLATSVTLFGTPNIYLVYQPTEQVECYNELVKNADLLAKSEHHFVVSAGGLSVVDKKLLTAVATTHTEYKKVDSERFNLFALAEALAGRDKRTLWFLLQDARREGIATEEIIGVLWWQLKTMRLAAGTNSATEAGVKDYPYNKAKRALSRFKAGEVEALARALLFLYHAGHTGRVDIGLALERWVLEM